MMGRYNIVEMLVSRGVRINATNMGDDTALHLAAAHNHRDIAFLVISLLVSKFVTLPKYDCYVIEKKFVREN